MLTGTLWLKGLHPQLPGFSCPLRALTGIPCPTCFLTRAISAALTGDLHDAVHWHLFGPVMAAVLVGWSVVSIRQRQLMPRGVFRGAAARPTILATAPKPQRLALPRLNQRKSPR